MGDTDAGAGAASSLGPADTVGLAASRALMEGGSLPPRKRLLAGLKQNGWLSTSPPPVVSESGGGGHARDVGNEAAGMGERASGKQEDGCMGCKVVEGEGMRRIKRGGVSLRLCSACAVLYSKSMFCPHCLDMYHDASLLGDPSMWLVCSRCRRSVHPECEQKHSGSMPDAASYVCLDCVTSARRQREANGVTGMRSKPSSGRSGLHPHAGGGGGGGGGGGAGAGVGVAGGLNPALKKPRMMRHADGSRFERHRSGPDATGVSLGPPRKVASQLHGQGQGQGQAQPQSGGASAQDAAVAARSAANAAAKVAAAAKANAVAKASAAVKAAAAAKAALDAAAHACRSEAACRAEVRRKVANAENRSGRGGAMRLEINVHSEPRRERSSKGEMKYEREEGYGGRRGGAGSVDDEEMARQLHRVINSSPRIARSATPMQRRASVKAETPSSGVSNSSTEGARARARTGAPIGGERAQNQSQNPHQYQQQNHQQRAQQQLRHQQTRPRSITHKEFRRIDSRASRHEVKLAVDGEQRDAFVAAGDHPEAALNAVDARPAEEPASGLDSEAREGVMEFGAAGVHDDASILFDALVEANGEGMHAGGGNVGVDDQRPDYLQEILEAAVLTDTAMSFNDGGAVHVEVCDMETVRSGGETGEQGNETAGTSGLIGVGEEGGSKDVGGDVVEAMAPGAEATGTGNVEEKGSIGGQDVEMQEAGGGAAPSEDVGGGTSGPPGVSDVRLEASCVAVQLDVGIAGPCGAGEVRLEASFFAVDDCSPGPSGVSEVRLEASCVAGDDCSPGPSGVSEVRLEAACVAEDGGIPGPSGVSEVRLEASCVAVDDCSPGPSGVSEVRLEASCVAEDGGTPGPSGASVVSLEGWVGEAHDARREGVDVSVGTASLVGLGGGVS